jgi:hypothetical protein
MTSSKRATRYNPDLDVDFASERRVTARAATRQLCKTCAAAAKDTADAAAIGRAEPTSCHVARISGLLRAARR